MYHLYHSSLTGFQQHHSSAILLVTEMAELISVLLSHKKTQGVLSGSGYG
jgi:hypothetical protein